MNNSIKIDNKKEFIYLTYFDSIDSLQDLINLLNSYKKENIQEPFYIIIPTSELYNSIYILLNNQYYEEKIYFFIFENYSLNNNIEPNYYYFYSFIYFLFYNKDNYDYFIECKLPCIFHKNIKEYINDITNNLYTLYTINKSNIEYDIYNKNTPSLVKKIIDLKLNKMDFDFLHTRIYSSYFLNLFFKENKFDFNNIINQSKKIIQLCDLYSDFKPIFYYFYIFFLIVNNQIKVYDISSSLNLPEYFYQFNNQSLNQVFKYFPHFKYHFYIY